MNCILMFEKAIIKVITKDHFDPYIELLVPEFGIDLTSCTFADKIRLFKMVFAFDERINEFKAKYRFVGVQEG